MIEDFVAVIKQFIGQDLNNRIYMNAVPVGASYPSLMFRRVFTDPYQTKDGAGRAMTRFRCWVFDKYGSEGTLSPSQNTYDITQRLRADINGYIYNGSEYRMEDERDDYEEELELHYTIFDITVQHDSV